MRIRALLAGTDVERNSMLYWFGVYALVVTAVLLPFLALYMVVSALWLGPKAVRFIIRGLPEVIATRRRRNAALRVPPGHSAGSRLAG
jgi:hypothetical protein